MTIGVPYELFWHLNPTKLKPFYTAFENKRKMRDEEQWLYWGTYGMSALSVVLENAFSKNSKAEYIQKPVYQTESKNNEQITKEEKKQKTEKLFMQLILMEANFNLNHKSDRK